MSRAALLVGTALLFVSASAGATCSAHDRQLSPAAQHLIRELAGEVSAERLHGAVESLVGFGTRHTSSDTRSDSRGIGAARRWVEGRFRAVSKDCSRCLDIVTPSQVVTGERIAQPTDIVDVLAIQRGATYPNRVILITAHVDSRVSEVMNSVADAPGADDDASGVAAVLEAARLLSRRRFAATLVYGVLSGEEQGLYGGKLLADFAARKGWRVEADLNNDIIGNTHGQSGVHDDAHVRVFSEGTKSTENAEAAKTRRYNGGEVDSPARNLARYMSQLAADNLPGLQVRMIYRTDRLGRGGDQVPFLQSGYPAVRITEAAENYDRQHQDVRVVDGRPYGDVIEGVDFPYLAKVTRLNVITLAALASAPAAPAQVKIGGAVTADTVLSWTLTPGAVAYRVWWRETTASKWRYVRSAGPSTQLTLPGVNVDDFFFGVSAVSADGFASPVEFPGAAGAFFETQLGP